MALLIGLLITSLSKVIFLIFTLLFPFSLVEKFFNNVTKIELPSLRISLLISNKSEKTNSSNVVLKSDNFSIA